MDETKSKPDQAPQQLKMIICNIVEAYDSFIPIVGPIMDLQIIDEFEEKAIGYIVDTLNKVSDCTIQDDYMPWSA